MARMVVAGFLGCSRFAHVDHFAEYLSETLPDFQYHRIAINRYEWPAYVAELTQKNKWNITQSPIVWTEPGVSGGAAYLLGGASEFWEHIETYYGVISNLTKEEGVLLAQDAYQKFLDDEREREEQDRKPRYRRITISGAGHSMTSLLVYELFRVRQLQLELGTIVTLFDYEADVNDLREIAMDMRGVGADAGLRACRAVETTAEAFSLCDLIIVLDGRKKEDGDDLKSWLRRNYELMTNLGLDMNRHASEACRVVYAAPDTPACFNATVLADTVIDIKKENVVAITADLGLEALQTITESLEFPVPMTDMFCPPVWGFIGVNKLVDLRGTRHRTELIMPNKRSLKAVPGTTLPTYSTKPVNYPIGPVLGTAAGLWLKIAQEKEKSINEMYFAKVKATCDMLGLWFGKQAPLLKGPKHELMYRLSRVTPHNFRDPKKALLPKVPIISLGILSNGAFEIPEGMNISQQVCLRGGNWVPYKHFPLRKDRYVKLKELWTLPGILLKEFNVGGTLNADHLLNDEELAEKKKAKFLEENKHIILKEEKKRKEAFEDMSRRRELDRMFKRQMKKLHRESEIIIRNNVIAVTMRELINGVLDICEPYPEKVEIAYKPKKGEISGEGGEEPQPEEEKEEDEDDDDYEDDDEDDD